MSVLSRVKLFLWTLSYRKVTEHLLQGYDSRPQPGLYSSVDERMFFGFARITRIVSETVSELHARLFMARAAERRQLVQNVRQQLYL
jgi:hypothetical protein